MPALRCSGTVEIEREINYILPASRAARCLNTYRPSSASGRTRIELVVTALDALVALKPHARKKRTLRHATDRRPQRYAIKC